MAKEALKLYLVWEEEHDEETCPKTYESSAGSIEVQSVKNIFSRYEQLYGVKWVIAIPKRSRKFLN